MRVVAWSVVVTSTAVIVLAAAGRAGGDLRLAGIAGGALVALAGVVIGMAVAGSRPPAPPAGHGVPMPRFFRERRRSPRLQAEKRVRVAVDGHAYPAQLVSVSANGALLRLQPHIARRLRAGVGSPVRIDDHPVGAIARVGAHGLYVDFAVALTPVAGASSGSPPPPQRPASLPHVP